MPFLNSNKHLLWQSSDSNLASHAEKTQTDKSINQSSDPNVENGTWLEKPPDRWFSFGEDGLNLTGCLLTCKFSRF